MAEPAPFGPAVAPVAGLVNVGSVVGGGDVSGSLDELVDLIAQLQDNLAPDYSGIVLDRNAIVSAVGQIKVATSEHQYFSSDSVLLRATWRFGHAVVRPNRIGTFTIADGS